MCYEKTTGYRPPYTYCPVCHERMPWSLEPQGMCDNCVLEEDDEDDQDDYEYE